MKLLSWLKSNGFNKQSFSRFSLSGGKMFYNGKIAKADKGIDLSNEKGPFDIVGDVHGCYSELVLLIERLGYSIQRAPGSDYGVTLQSPEGRKLIFLGDLVDRGPDSASVLKLAMHVVKSGKGLCIPGNHDEKLLRYLMGRRVRLAHGLEITVEQLKREGLTFKKQVKEFLETLPSYLILDDKKLIVVHAGLKEEYHGKASREVREFCLYGESTGIENEYGLPERVNWAASYSGKPFIVYGHTAMEEPYWMNNTVDIDTGCVFGGKLTALRYPEMETVSVDAISEYIKKDKRFGF